MDYKVIKSYAGVEVGSIIKNPISPEYMVAIGYIKPMEVITPKAKTKIDPEAKKRKNKIDPEAKKLKNKSV